MFACMKVGVINRPPGKTYALTDGTETRQRVTISAAKMLQRQFGRGERALEVRGRVNLRPQEALSGSWTLISID